MLVCLPRSSLVVGCAPLVASLVLSLSPVLSRAAHAESVAVIPVSFGESSPTLTHARKLGAALSERGYHVLSQAQVVQRLSQDRLATAIDLDHFNQQLDEERRGQGDLSKSVSVLQNIVTTLESDPAPTQAKGEVLQHARLMLARTLYQLAFFTGDRDRNQLIQQRIFSTLQAAVRADPFVNMPLDQYSPEVRRLLDQARDQVTKKGTGRLEVHCHFSDGQVFVDGRQVGNAPVYIDDKRPLGTYRLWVQNAQCRSRTHWVEVKSAGTRVDIDLRFDCAVDPQDGTLRFAENSLISDALALDAGKALGVDLVVITGSINRDDGPWAFAVLYQVKAGQALRRGAVRLQEPVDTQLEQLATFLHQPQSQQQNKAPFTLPVEGAPQATSLSQQVPALASMPPLLLASAISGGVGLLGMLSAGTGMLVWFSAYQALVQTTVPRDQVQGLTDQANLGWNLAGVGGLVGVLAAAGAGVLFYLHHQSEQAEGEKTATISPTQPEPGQNKHATPDPRSPKPRSQKPNPLPSQSDLQDPDAARGPIPEISNLFNNIKILAFYGALS